MKNRYTQFLVAAVMSFLGLTVFAVPAAAADANDGTPFTLTVDNVEDLNLILYPGWTDLGAQPGTATYYYPAEANTLMVFRADYGPCAKVTLNGADVPFEDGAYRVALSPNCNVNVQRNFVQANCSITLDAQNVADGFWTNVYVDGMDADMTSGVINVASGHKVRLVNTNIANWDVNSITMPDGTVLSNPNGGSYQLADGALEFFATTSGTLSVDATKASSDINVTFNISGYDKVAVYNGTSPYGTSEVAGLKEGTTQVKLSRNNANVTIGLRDANNGNLRQVTYRVRSGAELANAPYNSVRGTYTLRNLEEGAEVNIDASSETEKIMLNIDIDVPQAVKLYSNWKDLDNNLINVDLVSGVNQVEFPAGKEFLYIAPANEDCQVTSVTVDGNNECARYDNGYYVAKPTNGLNITVKAATKRYEHRAVIFVDNAYTTTGGVVMSVNGGRSVSLVTGYNQFNFNEFENELGGAHGMTLALRGEGNFNVYLNGQRMEKTASDATYVTINLKNNDVVKVYIENPAPSESTVNFIVNPEVDPDPEVGFEDVLVDLFTPVENLSGPMKVLPKTRFDFKVNMPEAYDYTVDLNGDDLASTGGVYSVEVTSDCNIRLTYREAAPKPVTWAVNTATGTIDMVESDGKYSCSMAVLDGEFTIAGSDGTVYGKSTGDVKLGEEYTMTVDGEPMTLEGGKAEAVTIVFNPESGSIVVTGTNSSAIETVAVENLDVNAIYFDLTGRRVAFDRVRGGYYIRLANGEARKIAVK